MMYAKILNVKIEIGLTGVSMKNMTFSIEYHPQNTHTHTQLLSIHKSIKKS